LSGDAISAAPATGRIELADILARHGAEFSSQHRLPLRHLRVMQRIVDCRTATLGGHRQWCDACGYERYCYHSCRNRHCPKCQTQAKEAWRDARKCELLPVPYFHQVFTLPHEFNEWILASEQNQRALLKLLFDSAAGTLLAFGRGELDGQVGFTLVLHTWDQLLRPHFHLHGLIPAGALSTDETRWIAGGAKFLFPVRALSKKFRGKFLAGFKELLKRGELRLPRDYAAGYKQVRPMIRRLQKKSWVIYSKRPFAGPAKLLDYLSRYTHRVAISNDRLVALGNGQVTFTYRDRRDGDRRKLKTLPAKQFIGRFLTHVLPDSFMRIRHYGFLSNRNRKRKLATIRKLLGVRIPPTQPPAQTAQQWLEAILDIDTSRCPCCGSLMSESELGPVRPAKRFASIRPSQPRAPPQGPTP
jgi:predicted Zn-ribbon and HTH transcriptional regulator